MKMKRLVTNLLVGCLLLTNAPLPAFAEEVGTGTSNTDSSFDSSVMYNSADLVVMIPDEVPLELNDAGDAFEGSGFVTAWGNAANSQEVKVTVGTSIKYQHSVDSSITVDATVSFDGDFDTLGYDISRTEVIDIATWGGETLRNNIDAVQKVGDNVEVYVPLSQVSDIGTYNSVIPFNIEVGTIEDGDLGDDDGDDDDEGGEVVDVISNENDYVYYEDTYNGVEGYAVYGLSEEGLAKASATADAGQTFTLDMPDTYNGKPVIALDFNKNATSNAQDFNTVFSDSKYNDIAVVTGANTLYVEGAWNSGTTFLQKVSSIDLNDGLVEIQSEAFKNKSGETSALRSVSIPASLTTIGSTAFANHPNLESVTFAEGFNTDIDNDIFSGTAIKEISIPSSMITFNIGAFDDTPISVIHFNNTSAGVTIKNNNGFYAVLDFTDVDYLGLVNDSYRITGTTVDNNYNIHVGTCLVSESIGSSVYKYLDEYQSNSGGILILDEGVTTIDERLGGAGVTIQLPSTITTISKKSAFSDATFTGVVDLREATISATSVLNNINADAVIIDYESLSSFSGTPQINNLYIDSGENTFEGSPASTSMDMSGINNIYFEGTEDNWATVKELLKYFDTSFTGNLYLNQSY